jgi:hypothetical protein
MASTASSNGREHVADNLREAYADHERSQSAHIDALVADLELGIAAEEHGRAELERLIHDSKTRESRMRKALTALDASPPASSAPKPAKPDGHGWAVSDARVAWVLEKFKEWLATEPEGLHTKTALSEWINETAHARGEQGVAHETVGKALEVLREREFVRVTGATRGGGKTWALMPNAVADAS